MRTSCNVCGRVFDDAVFRYYPCPEHPPVQGGSYCRTHDMFDCPICAGGRNIKVKHVSFLAWLREPKFILPFLRNDAMRFLIPANTEDAHLFTARAIPISNLRNSWSWWKPWQWLVTKTKLVVIMRMEAKLWNFGSLYASHTTVTGRWASRNIEVPREPRKVFAAKSDTPFMIEVDLEDFEKRFFGQLIAGQGIDEWPPKDKGHGDEIN